MDELYYKKKYQKYKMKYILYSKMNANNKLYGGNFLIIDTIATIIARNYIYYSWSN